MSAETKLELMGLVDGAVKAGWAHARACRVLQIEDVRMYRWRARLAETGSLDDRPPIGDAVHRIVPEEEQAILELIETFSGQVSAFAFSLPGFAGGAWTHRPAAVVSLSPTNPARNQWTNRPGELSFAEESGLGSVAGAGGDDGIGGACRAGCAPPVRRRVARRVGI